jgi:hypothetical protein
MARTGSPVHPRAGTGGRGRGHGRITGRPGRTVSRARLTGAHHGAARGTHQGQHGPTLASPGSLRGEGPGYLSHSFRPRGYTPGSPRGETRGGDQGPHQRGTRGTEQGRGDREGHG